MSAPNSIFKRIQIYDPDAKTSRVMVCIGVTLILGLLVATIYLRHM